MDKKNLNNAYYMGGSPGLVEKGGDSYSEGCEFESQHTILDGIFHIDVF